MVVTYMIMHKLFYDYFTSFNYKTRYVYTDYY